MRARAANTMILNPSGHRDSKTQLSVPVLMGTGTGGSHYLPVDMKDVPQAVSSCFLTLVCESTDPLQPVSCWFWKAWSLSAFLFSVAIVFKFG